jgi:dTMP kinase
VGDLKDKLAGKFIVMDGPDGCGKSTQIKLLADWLTAEGVPVCRTRDPGGTTVGEKIRQVLLDKAHDEMAVECELMLYMASRAQLVAQVIRPALLDAQCVLCDRYISSTIAYQGAGGIPASAVRVVGNIAVGGIWPDLTIILDIPAEVGLSRLKGSPDRMESKAREFHRQVRQSFLDQARERPERYAIVNGSGTVADVQSRIRKVIEQREFRRSGNGGGPGRDAEDA